LDKIRRLKLNLSEDRQLEEHLRQGEEIICLLKDHAGRRDFSKGETVLGVFPSRRFVLMQITGVRSRVLKKYPANVVKEILKKVGEANDNDIFTILALRAVRFEGKPIVCDHMPEVS